MMKPTESLSSNTEAAADTLAAMIKRELTVFSCSGYLNPSDPTMVTSYDRMLLVDWCYDVIDHCEHSRETVASAMEMVDRFLSMPSNSDEAAGIIEEALHNQRGFQLLTITALYISIKTNEKIVLSSDLFAEMCNRAYSAKEIEDMERILLCGLSWRCHAPTAYQAGLSTLSLIMPYIDIPEVTWGFLLDEMKYQTEHAVRDYYFSTQRPSTIALAAILNTVSDICTEERLEKLGNFLSVITECFDFDQPEQVSAVRSRLQSLLVKADTLMPGENYEDGDDCLDHSVRTLKASNTSSLKLKRDLEGHLCRESTESPSKKTPRSSIRDVQEFDLHSLYTC